MAMSSDSFDEFRRHGASRRLTADDTLIRDSLLCFAI
jgi:hypothetical protein